MLVPGNPGQPPGFTKIKSFNPKRKPLPKKYFGKLNLRRVKFN